MHTVLLVEACDRPRVECDTQSEHPITRHESHRAFSSAATSTKQNSCSLIQQNYRAHARTILILLLLTLSSFTHASPYSSSSSSLHSLPSSTMELHHLSLYSHPASPPTTFSFILFTIPFTSPIHVQLPKEHLTDEDDSTFEMKELRDLHVTQLGADLAEIECSNHVVDAIDDLSIRLHNLALSHVTPVLNATTSRHTSHSSSFDHWLISHDPSHPSRTSEKTPHHTRIGHLEATYILPQLKGHRETELGKYIRTLPKVRRMLREYPHTLLMATPVEAHLPFYSEVVLFDSDLLLKPSSSTSRPPMSCQFRFLSRKSQRAWPITVAYSETRTSNGRTRRRSLATAEHERSIAPLVSLVPQHGVLIVTPHESVDRMIARELRPSLTELQSLENEARSRSEALFAARQARLDHETGVVSLLDIDAVLGVQGASVKAVLDPVLKLLGEAVADEAEHTVDQEVGSRIDTVTPGQVLELVMTPLREALVEGVGPGVSDSIMASLKESMTEYLSTYIHDEVTHDATPPLYQAVTEILEKHVKDEILKLVPPAIRKYVPIVLSNRLGRSLIHSIPPSLTHVLKIAHSPTLHYFCYRCMYADRKKYSLFKPLSPGMPESGYAKKEYCELCHSSAERIYYHNYHSTYYADYYSDYYVPYFTQSLVEMENARTGRDNAYNRPAEKDIKFDDPTPAEGGEGGEGGEGEGGEGGGEEAGGGEAAEE